VAKDGQMWRVGTSAEVAWIAEGTTGGRTISAAIPLVFDAYATVVLPDDDKDLARHERAVLALLSTQPGGQPWWLGYLDAMPGEGNLVIANAPTVTVFYGWRYELVEAGPDQAGTWIRSNGYRNGVLPDLMFPADRSWLFSTLWDDDWSCLGGSARLVEDFLRHPDLEARRVVPGQDATPPGHTAI
jgi:hypothetical protein